MEKLIELLNEFAHTYADHYDDTGEEIECKFLYHTDQCFTYEEEGKYDTLVDYVVISKRFRFIKWLIDNDKIKYYKVPEHIHVSDYSFETIHEGMTDNILMWLAIQDEPLKFLISILK